MFVEVGSEEMGSPTVKTQIICCITNSHDFICRKMFSFMFTINVLLEHISKKDT